MSNPVKLAESMANAQIFQDLDDDARLQIAREMRPTSFTSGQSIFSRGDPGKELYFIVDGRVRLSILSAEGRELAFAHAGPGSIFGEIAMIDGKARTADATAVAKTSAMSLGHAAMERLFETSPDFGKALLRFVCARLRDADLQLEGVALHRIEVRLARFMIGLCEQRREFLDEDGFVPIELGMSQGELALLLGASRPKVNAALMLLEDQGAVRREGNKIHCDIDELRILAEMD
ncbi:MAG: Crp/Fnr family transcriptional regulator [Hyphomicrobiaceae bacterium]